jgi:parallel beta-helix repeat protein
MARFPIQFQSQDQNGKIIVGASVVFSLTGTDTSITCYEAQSGGSAVANATFTTDSNGRVKCWIDEADYAYTQRFRVTMSGSRFVTQVLDDIGVLPATLEGTQILSTGEAGGVKFLREDGDGTSSWQVVTLEGTAILSTGETGGVKYLREDGDGSSSWQNPYYTSIIDYGATSGGTAADNTTAINLAITTANAAAAGNSSVVWVPQGTYSITGITMLSNVTLKGEGKTSLLSLAANSDTAVITMGVVNDVVIDSIGIDGNSGAQTAGSPSTYNGIRLLGAATNCTFTNNDITDCLSTAIFVDKDTGAGPDNVRIDSNFVHETGARTDNTSRGIWVRNATNASISNNYVRAEDGFGITVQLSSQAKVANNFVINTTNFDGIMVYDSDRTIVIGNMVINSGDTGIVVELSDYFTVTGNHVFDSPIDGIIISGSSYGTVSSNSVLNSSQTTNDSRYGIVVQSSGGTISTLDIIANNMVRDVGANKVKSSISILDSSQTLHVIRGNTVAGAVTSSYNYQADTDHDFGGILSHPVVLAAAATTIAVYAEFVSITGDAGTNTIATITGGTKGMMLRLFFNDGLVTITDTAAGTADTVNLSGAFTGAANTVLTLIYSGAKWYEISRSVN